MDADHLGAGASGGAAGLLMPGPRRGSDPTHFAELGTLGLDLWRRWHDAVPGGVGLVDMDWIGLEPHPPGWIPPPETEPLNAAQVAEAVPGLAVAVPGVLIRHQGRLNPLVALARLAATLPAVATGVAVTAVSSRAGRITEVATTAGHVRPGTVVFATGAPPELPGSTWLCPIARCEGTFW